MIIISVIVCTHNRYPLIRQCIESLIDQSFDKDKYEILIIDNKSTDGTKRSVLEYTEKSAIVKYVYEEELGLSNARNRGIKEAKGEYLAFIDDDAVADEEWLSSIVSCFQEPQLRVDIVGGKVLLKHERETIPAGIPDMYFSKLDHGDKGLLLSANGKLTRYLNGTNFAIRKKIIEKTGYFDVHLGRKGGSLGSREESKFMEEAARKDCVIYYAPAIRVTHFIPKERVGFFFLIRRSFCEGVSMVLSSKMRYFPGSRKGFVVKGIRIILGNLWKLISGSPYPIYTLLEMGQTAGVIYAVIFIK